MEHPRVSFIAANEQPAEDEEIELLGKIDLRSLLSVRRPRAHRKQKHIPGYFWMAQTDQLVWYESRLEMFILKSIDHERSVSGAISQPFLMSFRREGKTRRHTPDFLFPLCDGGALLVNVTSQRHVDDQENQVNFDACKSLADHLGWEYVTRTEPNADYAANIDWLNGYRRSPWLLEKFRTQLLQRASETTTIGQILLGMEPDAFARPALFHLMWKREILFDSSTPLSDSTELWPGNVQ